MHRKYKGNIMSNNSIRYNRFVNKKTKNIYYLIDKEDDDITKLNCLKLYDFSTSNKKEKEMNYRTKHYKITDNDFDF